MRCDECGFVYEEVPVEAIAPRLHALAERFAAALTATDQATAARRPRPDVWSPLEYVCHVRDVLLVQRDRAVVALVEDHPSVSRMYREERLELCQYSAQLIAEAVEQLSMAASLCATVFGRIAAPAWARPLVYNYPTATDRDVAWLGRHTLHEGEHHLMDVERGLTLP